MFFARRPGVRLGKMSRRRSQLPQPGMLLPPWGFSQMLPMAGSFMVGSNSPTVPPYILVWFTHDGGDFVEYGVVNSTGVSAESFSPWYLDFSDNQHGWLLVLLGEGMMHAYVALYSTGDGGATWTDILDPSTENDIQSFTKTGMIFIRCAHWLADTGRPGG